MRTLETIGADEYFVDFPVGRPPGDEMDTLIPALEDYVLPGDVVSIVPDPQLDGVNAVRIDRVGHLIDLLVNSNDEWGPEEVEFEDWPPRARV